MANWFQRFAARITREYDRRIRRASQITEYNAHHHGSEEDEDDGAVEIVNVPRGAIVAPRRGEDNEANGRD